MTISWAGGAVLLSALAEDGVLGVGFFTSERHYPIMSYSLKISLTFQFPVISIIPKTIQMQKGGLTTMKCKTVIVSLALLMLILCSASQSQAAYGSKPYSIHPNDQVLDEHPWQESGAPLNDDIISVFTINDVLIVVLYTKIIIIKSPPQPRASQIGGDRKVDSTLNKGIR
jgi:hypothetical protein